MELLLIRHAQPAWVVEGKSDLDPELTDLGRRQTTKLAERLAAMRPKPTRLFVSPKTRTRQTAEPLARALESEPVLVPGLREIEMNPAWDGRPAGSVGSTLRAIKARPPTEWWSGLPGGESYEQFHERVTRGMDDVLQEQGLRAAPPVWSGAPNMEQRLVFVTHGGTNAVLLGHLLGLPPVPWAWERFVTRHASVTRLRLGPLMGGLLFGLRELSDVAHLEGEERTR